MPRLNLPTLLQRLADRPASAVAFLYGDEAYLREEAVQRVVRTLLDPATRDFNFDQLQGGETAAETLASFVATPPLMADYRVVVVREVQGLTAKARETVEAAVERPAAGVLLVLVGTIPSGSKARFYDNLIATTYAVEFPALDPHDLPGWLVERARVNHGLDLEIEAARALSAAIGSELGVLASELEKAAAYVGERTRISLADIRAVGGYIPRVDRWAWFDAVGERRIEKALTELPELLDSGETGVGLVIGLTGHLLKLGIAAAGGKNALERTLRPNQRWLANRLLPQARRWKPPEIDQALDELLRTDRLLKSASMTDRQAVEELLLRLAGTGTS